jgi:hypothetical protein
MRNEYRDGIADCCRLQDEYIANARTRPQRIKLLEYGLMNARDGTFSAIELLAQADEIADAKDRSIGILEVSNAVLCRTIATLERTQALLLQRLGLCLDTSEVLTTIH